MTHLTVFDKIGVDWTAPVTAGPPLQVIHIGLVSLRRAGDDRRLWSRTVTTPIRRQIDRVDVVFSRGGLVALVALHGVKRRWSLQQHAGSGIKLWLCHWEESKMIIRSKLADVLTLTLPQSYCSTKMLIFVSHYSVMSLNACGWLVWKDVI